MYRRSRFIPAKYYMSGSARRDCWRIELVVVFRRSKVLSLHVGCATERSWADYSGKPGPGGISCWPDLQPRRFCWSCDHLRRWRQVKGELREALASCEELLIPIYNPYHPIPSDIVC